MLGLLIRHAYGWMIPLSLIEGPLVALAGGVDAAMGKINPWLTYGIVMGGGLFQDVVYYWIGRLAMRSDKIRALARRMRLIRKGAAALETAWCDKTFITLAVSKFAYGLYAPIIVSAKAPYGRFLWQSLFLSGIVLAGWLAAGFGMGRAYGALGAAANWASLTLGMIAIAGLYIIGRSARAKLQPGR